MLVRIIKLIFSCFFFIYLKIKHWIGYLLGINQNPFCITLYYHSVYLEEIKYFTKQMTLLKNKFEILKSDYFGELAPHKKYVIISFDDGFENLIDNAVPILTELKLPYTIFFISNYFGKIAGWEFNNKHRDRNQKIMTVDQMNNLDSSLLTIGSHTANHKKLTSLSKEELENELVNSKNTLEKLTKREITILSFPNGEFNKSIVNKSFEAGYKRVFTIEPRFSLQSKNENITGRVWVNANDWYPEFWLKVHGAYCWLNIAFSLKKKIKEIF